jgi:hypothetical protein
VKPGFPTTTNDDKIASSLSGGSSEQHLDSILWPESGFLQESVNLVSGFLWSLVADHWIQTNCNPTVMFRIMNSLRNVNVPLETIFPHKIIYLRPGFFFENHFTISLDRSVNPAIFS